MIRTARGCCGECVHSRSCVQTRCQLNAALIRSSASSRRASGTVSEIRKKPSPNSAVPMLLELCPGEQHDPEIWHSPKVRVGGDDGQLVLQRSCRDQRVDVANEL